MKAQDLREKSVEELNAELLNLLREQVAAVVVEVAEFVFLGDLVDGIADVADCVADFGGFDACVECLAGEFDECGVFGCCVADDEGACCVAAPAVEYCAEVD